MHNLQGDIVAILDSNGTAVVQYKYDAWGKPISKTGSMANTLGTVQPFRYRGYVYDEETGLYYLRSRYYNPSCCHFINMDSVLFKGLLFSNQQAYCCNNPVLHSDSNGRNIFEDALNGLCNFGKLLLDSATEHQRIQMENAQAEHKAWHAAGEVISDAASAGWDLFVDTVNETQRIAQANAQASRTAINQVVQGAWNLLLMVTEENQKIAQYNAQVEYQARKEALFWIDGLADKIDKAWSVGSHATTTAGFFVTKGVAKKVLGGLSGFIWVIDTIFIYANFMTDIWKKSEVTE